MIPRISRNSKRIIAVLSQNRKSSQIAWGVAIGVMIGLIPKDNLVVVVLVATLACLRVNQLVSCITALVVHLVSGIVSALTVMVGSSLLSQPIIIESIFFLYRFPLVPWTCLENALVLGGLGIGLMTLLPAYAITLWVVSRARDKLEQSALVQVVDNAIEYRKLVTEQSKKRQEKPSPTLKLIVDHSEFLPNLLPATTLTSHSESDPVDQTDVVEVEQSGDSQSEVVEKPTDLSIKSGSKTQQRVMPTIFTGETSWDGTDTLLRETVVEVVRYRRPIHEDRDTRPVSQQSPSITTIQGDSMPAGNASPVHSKEANSSVLSPANPIDHINPSRAYDSGHSPNPAAGRDESLRYLLWHINGSRENVRKTSEKTA